MAARCTELGAGAPEQGLGPHVRVAHFPGKSNGCRKSILFLLGASRLEATPSAQGSPSSAAWAVTWERAGGLPASQGLLGAWLQHSVGTVWESMSQAFAGGQREGRRAQPQPWEAAKGAGDAGTPDAHMSAIKRRILHFPILTPPCPAEEARDSSEMLQNVWNVSQKLCPPSGPSTITLQQKQ